MIYLRFGSIPKSGKSKNHLTGKDELGVSVYYAVRINGKLLPVLPSLTGSACVSLSGALNCPMFEVTGREVGIGSDGEPVLADVEICREVSYERD